jgi:hypothetical protein
MPRAVAAEKPPGQNVKMARTIIDIATAKNPTLLRALRTIVCLLLFPSMPMECTPDAVRTVFGE